MTLEFDAILYFDLDQLVLASIKKTPSDLPEVMPIRFPAPLLGIVWEGNQNIATLASAGN